MAKWDGVSWSEVGSGSAALNGNGAINTIFIDTSDNIYAAGNFTDSGLVDTSGNLYVAMWNGSSWNELGSGVCHQSGGGAVQIFSVVKDNSGNVYAAGNLRNSSNRTYVAKWDGTAWDEVGPGSAALNVNNAISILRLDISGNLYAAGWFTDTTATVPNYDQTYVIKWNGTLWSKLGDNFYGSYSGDYIVALCSDASGNIYAGGSFEDTTLTYIYVDTASLFPDTLIWHPKYVAKFGSTTSSVAALQTSNGLNVYPNPAHSTINISFNSAVKNLTGSDYYLYDCTGRILRSGKLENAITSIEIAELPTSVYVLKISGGCNASYRVVKE